MLDSYFLLRAMIGIHQEQLIAAQDFLGYMDDTSPQRSYQKIIGIALIAAAIASLLTVTAYALGWFGLRERSFETEPVQLPQMTARKPERDHWISLNGYKESPEYKANAEWGRFYWDYMQNTEIDYNSGFLDDKSADYIETCHYYGCADQVMADKLFEIAESYGLGLHTRMVTPVRLADFYRTAGTGEFLTEGCTGGGYIYEDGSFKMEGDIVDPAVSSGVPVGGFTFHRNMAGTVLPLFSGSSDPEDYSEWEYTNVHGDVVLISFNEDNGALEFFFDRDGVFLNVSAGPAETREEAEKLADLFIFHEALKSHVDLSVAFHGPTVCEDPGDTATLDDFLSSNEGKAAVAYFDYSYQQLGDYSGSYNPWYLPNEALLDKIEQLADAYHLRAPSKFSTLVASQELLETIGNDDSTPVMSSEEFAACGYDPEILETFLTLDLFDNGVMQIYDGVRLHYIPKGALDIVLDELPQEELGESWFYRTEKGYTVYITADLEKKYTRSRNVTALIVYETENGWIVGRPSWYNSAYEIEAWVDEIDFSIFD